MWLQQTCPGHSLHTWCPAQAEKCERVNKWASDLWKGFMETADDCESDSQQYVLIIYSLKQNYWALWNVFPHSAWGRYSSVRTVSTWDETCMRCWNQRLGWDRKPRKACDGLEGLSNGCIMVLVAVGNHDPQTPCCVFSISPDLLLSNTHCPYLKSWCLRVRFLR